MADNTQPPHPPRIAVKSQPLRKHGMKAKTRATKASAVSNRAVRGLKGR